MFRPFDISLIHPLSHHCTLSQSCLTTACGPPPPRSTRRRRGRYVTPAIPPPPSTGPSPPLPAPPPEQRAELEALRPRCIRAEPNRRARAASSPPGGPQGAALSAPRSPESPAPRVARRRLHERGLGSAAGATHRRERIARRGLAGLGSPESAAWPGPVCEAARGTARGRLLLPLAARWPTLYPEVVCRHPAGQVP